MALLLTSAHSGAMSVAGMWDPDAAHAGAESTAAMRLNGPALKNAQDDPPEGPVRRLTTDPAAGYAQPEARG